MVIEIAQLTEGTISEDGGKTFFTLEEFKRKHKDILDLTYKEAKIRSEVKKYGDNLNKKCLGKSISITLRCHQ